MMKENIDVIGIGAINLDFIFSSNRSDNTNRKNIIDDGEESFIEETVFKDCLLKVHQNTKLLQTQIGGSALLTIKALKSMCSNLRTAYVGVYGTIPEYVKGYDIYDGENEDLETYLSSFIDDKSWLFKNDEADTGCSLVKLYKKQRQFIHIYTGANEYLLNSINKKGESEFISYLASAKWIHMTSLKNTNQFKRIAEYIKIAKDINHNLKVSLDPGYDYTKNHWDIVKSVMSIADYVFLSKSEFSNICVNIGLTKKVKAEILGTELINCGANPQIIIIKDKNCNVLLNLINNKPFTRTYYHKKLTFTQILNDTGAGDVFAGGFIAGMLSPLMLSHQPAPIQLAAIAASERLKSVDWPSNLKETAYNFYCKGMKDEHLNIRQQIKMALESLKVPMIDIVIAVSTGLITSLIWNIIINKI